MQKLENSEFTFKHFSFSKRSTLGIPDFFFENLGIINTSDWGTPVVPVLKPNGKVRVCGDYKHNKSASRRREVSTTSHRGTIRKVAGRTIVHQVGFQSRFLNEESSKLFALSTQQVEYFNVKKKGFFKVFQLTDDIIITEKNNKEHMRNIRQLLSRLEKCGLKLENINASFSNPKSPTRGILLPWSGKM